ncbi:hypothetical protein R6Q59_020149 [Mikania micrantha]
MRPYGTKVAVLLAIQHERVKRATPVVRNYIVIKKLSGVLATHSILLQSAPAFGNRQIHKANSRCLTWLDQQPVCSVIYVAFGSITLLDQAQFEELALGLELTKKSFLWVVRLGKSENMDHEYPRGYMDRIGTRGKGSVMLTGSATGRFGAIRARDTHRFRHSQKVRDIMSSALRVRLHGRSMQVQLDIGSLSRVRERSKGSADCPAGSLIMWVRSHHKGSAKAQKGIVTREEIKSKVEELLSNNIIKENALTLQERVINSLQSGNSSNQNFKNFIDWIKEGNNRAHIDETFK